MQAHLDALYARSGDPWNTHTSPYERAKFAQTVACLPRARYRRGLEVGCGAGGLSARLARRCDLLVAMDCTERALASAQTRLTYPNITYLAGRAPAVWSSAAPDLVMLSEVLYFLTDAENAGVARRIVHDCAPGCDVVLVNWLGDTGGTLGGAAAAERMLAQLSSHASVVRSQDLQQFRIDVLRLQTAPGDPDPSAGTGAAAQ